mmetsp:Transcript_35752/g.65628  ORF Transcript_35752/g.65628 Transcript_35752/m.65628 type:complete len:892 (-) Transcript_35752:18-2693(-)
MNRTYTQLAWLAITIVAARAVENAQWWNWHYHAAHASVDSDGKVHVTHDNQAHLQSEFSRLGSSHSAPQWLRRALHAPGGARAPRGSELFATRPEPHEHKSLQDRIHSSKVYVREHNSTAKPVAAEQVTSQAESTVSTTSTPSLNETREMIKVGLQRNNKEMSPWLMFLITIVETLLLAGVLFKCTGYFLASGLDAAHATDLDALREEIEESKRRTTELENSLRMEVQQHMEEQGGSLTNAPQLASGSGEAVDANALSEAAREAAHEHTKHLGERTAAAQQALKAGVGVLRGKVEQLARDESQSIYQVVQDVMETQEVPDGAVPDWFPGSEENFNPPPAYLILCGLFAPAMMRGTFNHAKGMLLWDAILLAVTATLLVIDWKKTCKDMWVWVWQIGMMLFSAVDLACNLYLRRQCSSAIDELKESETLRKAKWQGTGHEAWDDLLFTLQDGGQYFFSALFKHDEIANSKPYHIVKCIQLLCIIWGFLSIKLSISNILEDAVNCDAGHILTFMHIYAVIYLMLFLANVLMLAFWILQQVAGSSLVSKPLLKVAKTLDEDVPFKVPVFMTLVRGLVLRNASDILKVKVRAIATDIQHLEEAHQRLVEEEGAKTTSLEKLKEELHKVESEHREACDLEKDMVDRYKQLTEEKLTALEPLVAFAAGQYEMQNSESLSLLAAAAQTAASDVAGDLSAAAMDAASATAASAANDIGAAVTDISAAASDLSRMAATGELTEMASGFVSPADVESLRAAAAAATEAVTTAVEGAEGVRLPDAANDAMNWATNAAAQAVEGAEGIGLPEGASEAMNWAANAASAAAQELPVAGMDLASAAEMATDVASAGVAAVQAASTIAVESTLSVAEGSQATSTAEPSAAATEGTSDTHPAPADAHS